MHNRPTGCPRCGCTDRVGLSGVKVAATPGEFGGERYTHVKRSRTQCRDCRQRYVVIDYLRPATRTKSEPRTKDHETCTEARTVEDESR